MYKCLKILVFGEFPTDFLREFVQKNARKLEIEGMAQLTEDGQAMVIACGKKDTVDSFVDVLHKGTSSVKVANIEIEPHLKDKDYRGVFRVIE